MRTRDEGRKYRARRRAYQPEPRAKNPYDLPVALATLIILAAIAYVTYQRLYAPAQPDYSADSPPAVVKPQPAQPLALPTPIPAQLDSIGAQAPHAVRNAEPTPAPAQPAPAEFVAPVELAPAQPIATIAPEQAQVIGARQSNGCAAGQVFMPRSGCHTPGSGGAMPGLVGQP